MKKSLKNTLIIIHITLLIISLFIVGKGIHSLITTEETFISIVTVLGGLLSATFQAWVVRIFKQSK